MFAFPWAFLFFLVTEGLSVGGKALVLHHAWFCIMLSGVTAENILSAGRETEPSRPEVWPRIAASQSLSDVILCCFIAQRMYCLLPDLRKASCSIWI